MPDQPIKIIPVGTVVKLSDKLEARVRRIQIDDNGVNYQVVYIDRHGEPVVKWVYRKEIVYYNGSYHTLGPEGYTDHKGETYVKPDTKSKVMSLRDIEEWWENRQIKGNKKEVDQ